MKTLAILVFFSLAVACLTSDSMDSNGDDHDDRNDRDDSYRRNYNGDDNYRRNYNGDDNLRRHYNGDDYRRNNGDDYRRNNNGDDYRRNNGDDGYRRNNNGDDTYHYRQGVFVERSQAAAVVPPRRAPVELSLTQMENLREVCESNVACEHMMDTDGVVAAYNAYYGPVPY
ncbi:osteocalcin [Corythoichthys intestinalis]|uniref:osteocalcin n=1 Tax=Corythoichthys intestinalis TaxID=161448 RepID=UPI0025A60A1B|nr:osteocalcin [Corythoichthys intestinalis]